MIKSKARRKAAKKRLKKRLNTAYKVAKTTPRAFRK